MTRFRKSDKLSQLRQILIIILVFLAGVFGSNLFNSSDNIFIRI